MSLDHYLATPKAWEQSAFDRPQGIRDKVNFMPKMLSHRDGFQGIKFPGFFCPHVQKCMYEQPFDS